MTSIHNAITQKNLYMLNQAIASGDSLAKPNAQGLTPLDSAIKHKDLAAVSALLKAFFGIDIDADQFSSQQLKSLEVQRHQLSKSIKEKALRVTFLTPKLHQAAFTGSLSFLEKADPKLLDSKDGKGLTPLHYAISGNQKEVIRFLLNKADLTYCTSDNTSYLHFAALTGDREILNLLQQANVNASLKNRDFFTAAHYWAASSDDLDGLNQLAKAGAPLYGMNQKNLTPLAIVFFKSLEKSKESLSGYDLLLFAIHTVQLSLALTMHETSYNLYSPKNIADYVIHSVAFSTLDFVKRFAIRSSIPSHQKALKELASPSMKLAGSWIDSIIDPARNFSPVSLLSSTAVAYAVAQNALKSLGRRKTSSSLKNAIAIPVHLFNTACSLFDMARTAIPSLFENSSFVEKLNLDFQKDSERFFRIFQKAQDSDVFCPPLDPTDFQKMPPMQRFTDPTLTNHLGKEEAFPCYEYDKILLNLTNLPSTCSEIKEAYRNLSLALHPDKNPGNKQAQESFIRLEASYKELKESHLC